MARYSTGGLVWGWAVGHRMFKFRTMVRHADASAARRRREGRSARDTYRTLACSTGWMNAPSSAEHLQR